MSSFDEFLVYPTNDAISGCSATWTVQNNTNIAGGLGSVAGSITDCRSDCNFNASCTSIDWVNSATAGKQCWLHGHWSAGKSTANYPGVEHHVISRKCGQWNISPSPSSSLLPPPSLSWFSSSSSFLFSSSSLLLLARLTLLQRAVGKGRSVCPFVTRVSHVYTVYGIENISYHV